MVDNPDWDRAAPNLEIVAGPKTKTKAGSAAGAPPTTSGEPVPRAAGIALMLVVGLGILGLAGFGVWQLLGTKDDRAATASTEAEAGVGGGTGTETQPKPTPAPQTPAELETLYKGYVAETAVALGIAPLTLEQLRQPNSFSNPITHGSPQVVGAGNSRRVGALSFKVRVDTLSLKRGGIVSKGKHTTLVVKNTSETPLAYYLLMRKAAGGECLSPVDFKYDAMVIDPGETFEISVCAGSHSVEIIDLRTLEITALGARWIRQLSPRVVGLGDAAARAHDPGPDVVSCKEDATEIIRALEGDLVEWEDVIDFYSRHDCRHYPWMSEYRLATAPLPGLPAQPAPPAPRP